MTQDPHQNPYAAGASIPSAAAPTNAETVRQRYLSHEASVKSIATLFLIGGVIGLLVSITYFVVGFSAVSGLNARPAAISLLALAAVFLGLAIAQIGVAVGVRKLDSWSRIPAAILAALSLVGFPIGTFLGGYMLYLLLSPKGSMVFSEEYKDIIRQTPHLRYKTSIVVWIALVLIMALILLGIGLSIFGG